MTRTCRSCTWYQTTERVSSATHRTHLEERCTLSTHQHVLTTVEPCRDYGAWTEAVIGDIARKAAALQRVIDTGGSVDSPGLNNDDSVRTKGFLGTPTAAGRRLRGILDHVPSLVETIRRLPPDTPPGDRYRIVSEVHSRLGMPRMLNVHPRDLR